jgi:hypothetical protein
MRKHVFWPKIYRDVKEYCRPCQPREKLKRISHLCNRHLYSTVPSCVWDTAHIDLVGPLPKAKHGNLYICVITDSFSKWSEAVAIPSKMTKLLPIPSILILSAVTHAQEKFEQIKAKNSRTNFYLA